MAFSFGQSSTSGGSGQSLFGTSNTPPSSSGPSLFGGAPTSAANTASFSFGGFKPSTTTSAQPQGLFASGGANDNKPAPPTFGQQSGAPGNPASANIFGSKSQSSDATKPSFGGFAGFGTPDKSSTPTTSAPSLFGSTTPAPSKPFSLGANSTTPAGPPPASSAFGASTGGAGAGIFGAKPTEDASKPSFAFGKPAAPAASQPSGNLFGGLSGGFGLQKQAESSSTATPSMTAASAPESKGFSFGQPTSNSTTIPAPATSQPAGAPLFGEAPKQTTTPNMFGKPATTEAQGSAAKPTFAFGQPAATQASGAATLGTSAPAQKSLFSGFSLGGTPSTSPATTTATTTAPATSASPLSFGAPAGATTSQPANTSAPPANSFFGKPATTTSQPATTSAPAPSFFPLAKPAASSTSQPATTSAQTAGTAPAQASFPGTIGGQTSTAGPTPPAQSRLRNKTMDEILTRWATDMSRYSKEFKDHAETIAHWDQLIVDNSSKIDKLYVRARTCERQTVSVDMQLTAVENSQAELESWLSKYENDVDEMLAKDSAAPGEMAGPDQERERTYKLAEKLGERLEEMERDLENMVDEVNAANASLSRSGKGDEPITQIVKILNSHLIQLQAIDQGTQTLQEKVAVAQKSASQLGYLTGYGSSSTTNGSNTGAAVQDFYRSYMGRR
ncbi:uncharacterized protein Z520_01056 [Fonsecaea multimorphosa CBS 102226]|uniref:Nucleoporin NSP1-like C-terminal domain-containing protein n=1 Tax=Fonsecaea multimorphosa CBS 102226 TaxID=1442371 RepID=A0A0D2HL02_9EURO|nr:uncharacterized protein Z520_01056 [Fonsecaea multimorphosa CBS 102226]KIY02591.1 hypothetical protein Z520_01056 [Fonsecaea multimorphosa CBS 102226]OAL31457.1 hypothetical protein AYO22_01049 [Fonsecaea multimorphosa]